MVVLTQMNFNTCAVRAIERIHDVSMVQTFGYMQLIYISYVKV